MTSISREEKLGVTRDSILENFKYSRGKLICIKGRSSSIGKWDWGISAGYRMTRVNGVLCYVHRLIWIIHFGFIPNGKMIDHINRKKLDNRIKNLRLVNHAENCMNRSDNKSGFSGICYLPFYSKEFTAHIQINGTRYNLGGYNTIEEAIEARRKAEASLNVEIRECFYSVSP